MGGGGVLLRIVQLKFHCHQKFYAVKRISVFPLLMALPLSFLHLMIVSHKSIKSSINILNMQAMPSEGQSFGSRLKNSNKSFIIIIIYATNYCFQGYQVREAVILKSSITYI